MKYLSIGLLALALAACDAGATSPSTEPLPSIGSTSMAPDHSMDADESMDLESSASAEASSATGLTCEEAFAALDAASLSTLNGLQSAGDLLDETIGSCDTLAEWQTQLSTLLPTLDTSAAEQFVAERCAESTRIVGAAICAELEM
jgi:hypothetical protein